MGDEAVEIMKFLVGRGASRATLVRAATAAARAVVPLAGKRQAEAIAAILIAEHWAEDPNEGNTGLAENHVFNMGFATKAGRHYPKRLRF